MKRFFTYSLFALFAIAFFVGIGFRLASGGSMSPSAWTFWLGDAILNLLCASVGLSICVTITVNPSFVIELRSLMRLPRKFMESEPTLLERIAWFVVGAIMVLVGIALVLNALFMCPALRC